MAAPIYYALDAVISGSEFMDVQDGSDANRAIPATATATSKWTPGTTGTTPKYSRMASLFTRTTTDWVTTEPTTGPDSSIGDAFRTGRIWGTFANASWAFAFEVIGSGTNTGSGRIDIEVYKSSNADGSSATKLNSSTIQSSAFTSLTSTAQALTASWSPGATITLNGEMLFFVITCVITANSGTAGRTVSLRKGTSNKVTPSTLTPSVISNFTDDFNAASIDRTKWPFVENSASIVSSKLELRCLAASTAYANAYGDRHLDLTGSAVYGRFVPATLETQRETHFSVIKEGDITNGSGNYIEWLAYASGLGARVVTAGTPSETTLTYNSTNHAWWRIRESGGNVLLDTAPDVSGAPGTWTNQKSVAKPSWITDCYILLSAGHFSTQASDSVATVDNINTAPVTYTDTASGTITESGSITEFRGKLFTETPSGSITESGTKTESKSIADTESGTVTLSGTKTESKTVSDSRSGTITESGTISEFIAHGYSDAPSGSIALSGTKTEGKAYGDTDSGSVVLSGTRTELYQPPIIHSEAPSGTIHLSGTETDSYETAAGYFDTTSGTIHLSGTADDEYIVAPDLSGISRLHVVSERPPTKVSINVVTPNRRTYRWGQDETRGEKAFQNLTWGSVAPGGFDQCGCVLNRDPRRHFEDIEPLSTLIVRDAGGGSVGEYRIEKTPLSSGEQMSISPAAVGWQAALEDDKGVSVIYIDRMLNNWGDTSGRRKAYIGSSPIWFNPFAGQVDNNVASKVTDTGSPNYGRIVPPTLVLRIGTLTQSLGVQGRHIDPADFGSALGANDQANPMSIAEGFYDAGVGNAISEVRGILYSQNLMTYPGWEWGFYTDIDETFDTGALYSSGPLAFTVGGDFSVFGGTTPRRFALVQLFYSGKFPFDGSYSKEADWNILMGWLRVIGSHGIPIRNPSDDEFAIAQANGWVDDQATYNNMAQGVLASDVCKHAVNAFCPALTARDENIERSTYIIPQLAFIEKTTVGNIVNESTKFGAPPPDWFVWENRNFHLYRRGVRGRSWRARVGPTQLSETGPDASRIWNAIYVSFTQGDKTFIVGPPGSGADYESPLLYDKSPDNPASQLHFTRRDILDMGDGDFSTAIKLGQIFLQQANQLDKSGQATIVGHVLDDHGVLHPYHAMRAGDTIKFTDSNDPSARRIVSVQCDDNARSASISLDAPPEGLDALLARLGVALIPLGFGG